MQMKLEELKIDSQKDFHNNAHLNTVGARKATRFLGDYLIKLEELNR